MKLAVIILNWNSAEDSVRCVERVSGWDSLKPEIFVVDNGSADGSAKIIAERCPTVRLVCSPSNRGYGGGNNLAIDLASKAASEAILLLNNDAVIAEADVGRLLQALADDPRVGVAGPFLRETYDGRPRYSLGGRSIAHHTDTRIVSDTLPETTNGVVDVDYVPGTAALIRSDVFDAVSLFDEEYFFSGEMADLCERARGRGYRVIMVPSALAEHDDGAGSRRQTLYAYYSLRNRFLFVRKHASPWYVALWTWRSLRMVGHHLRARRWLVARCHWMALVDGLRGRYGNQHERIQYR